MTRPSRPVEGGRTDPLLSVVVAVFNEEGSLGELERRLASTLSAADLQHELILVDDGSRDRSWETIRSLATANPHVQGIRLSRNFGQHIALTAGIDRARGEYVVLMDADLQDRPEEIPLLFAKAQEGYHIVYARRRSRSDPLIKRLTSRIFYRTFNAISSVRVDPDAGVFRLLHRRVVENLVQLREQARMLTVLVDWLGFRAAAVEVDRPARRAGGTKYTVRKMLRLAMAGITGFSVLPLRLAAFLGLAVSAISFGLAILFLYLKLRHDVGMLGWPSLIVSLFFLGGAQLLTLGIIGEYLGKVFIEVKRRPLYVVMEEEGTP